MAERSQRKNRRRGRRYWKNVVAEYERLGGSQTAFARERGLPISTFRRWLAKLRTEEVALEPVRFVELTPEPDLEPVAAPVRLSIGDAITLDLSELPPALYVAELYARVGGRC